MSNQPPKSFGSRDLIFSFSTGALALSVTFRNSLVGNEPQLLWLLSTAWIAFTLSSLSYIIAVMLDEYLDIYIAKHVPDSLTFKHKAMIVIPNFALTFTFMIGISAFLCFALANNTF